VRRPEVETLDLYWLLAAWLPIAGLTLALCLSPD
jgi:hypothetical protein